MRQSIGLLLGGSVVDVRKGGCRLAFHLTIDKENPKAVLSLCMSGLNKTGPTSFELRHAKFTPNEDIRLVVYLPGE